MQKLIEYPKKIFLLDGVGALISGICLLIIGAYFQQYFQMPLPILNFLAGIAISFCIYSICCYFFIKYNWHPFLLALSMANIVYCCITAILVVYYSNQISLPGTLYFIFEIFLIVTLVSIERKAITHHRSQQK